jgi:hypothetical protein
MIHMVATAQLLMCCKRQFYVQNVYELDEVIHMSQIKPEGYSCLCC